MLKCETTKLFYNKYMYKLLAFNQLATIFRNKNFANARKELDLLQRSYENGKPLIKYWGLRDFKIGTESFFDAKKLLASFQKYEGDFTLRVESSFISIFSNDKKWIEKIKNDITNDFAHEYWSPDPDLICYLDPKIILVNGPVNYKYKVTLGPKGEPSFATWAEKNPQHIKIGSIAKKEIKEDSWVNGFYFYAKNEKTLQICSLMLGNKIRRVDTLVSKQDIDK